jgi:hypothetical protein
MTSAVGIVGDFDALNHPRGSTVSGRQITRLVRIMFALRVMAGHHATRPEIT